MVNHYIGAANMSNLFSLLTPQFGHFPSKEVESDDV